MSDSPRWSGPRGDASRAAVRVLTAAGVLLLAELLHRGPSGGLRDGLDVLSLAAGVVTVVVLGEALVRAAWALCRRLSRRHALVWLCLASVPLALLLVAPDPWTRASPAARLALVGAALAGTTWAGAELASRVDRARVRRRARRWASLACAVALLASLASATEWLPRLVALWLAAVAVLAAVLFARLVVSPAARVPAGAGLGQAALVLLCLVATARHWDGPRQARLGSGEGGVLPGFRAVVHGSAGPLRAFARDDTARDARWTELRDPADPVSPDWQVLAGAARVEPGRGATPLGGSGAQAVALLTPDAVLAQGVPLEGPVEGVRAGVWLRRRGGGAAGLALRVTLEAFGARASRVVRPAEEWTELRLDLVPSALGDGPLTHALDPAHVHPEQGAAWWTELPPAFAPFAADVGRDPADARLLLFEDDVPLGPARSLHDAIRAPGRGAYSHWQGGLYFSTPDGSDPRSNGRVYRVELHRKRDDRPPRALLTLAVADSSAPAELWVWGPGLEVRRPDGELPEPPDGALRLVPSSGPLARAVRAATRHVLLVVLDEAPARAARSGALGRLGDAGLRAARAYAPSDRAPATLGALATGLPPPVLLAARELGAPVPGWLARLRDAGFHTFVQGLGAELRELDGLADGVLERGDPDPRAPDLPAELTALLRAHADGRVAALVHWAPARGASGGVDRRVAELTTGLQAAGFADDCLLVITAARGAEPGAAGGGQRVTGRSDRVLHVPLVLAVPGLDRPRELHAPLAVADVVATLLDVAAPADAALLHGASLLAELERAPAGARLPRPVLAWPDGARVLRLGDAKYVADERLGTHLLYDTAADPDERRPLYDASRAALLARRLEREERTLELLTRRLVSRHESELQQDLLAGLLVRELHADALVPLLEDFWSFNAATRRFLMETIYGRRVAGLAAALDGLARERFEPDDQVLLVLRAWAGSARAAQELPRRLPELGPAARRWLFEILPDLPAPLVRALHPLLLAELRGLRGAQPEPGSEEGRLLAVGVAHLAEALGRAVGAEPRRWLVELHGQWTRRALPPTATLREAAFGEEHLLRALLACAAPGDEALLAELQPSVSAARVVPELAAALDGPVAREALLALIDRWGAAGAEGARLVGHLLPGLRALPDDDFSRAAVARVERWRGGGR